MKNNTVSLFYCQYIKPAVIFKTEDFVCLNVLLSGIFSQIWKLIFAFVVWQNFFYVPNWLIVFFNSKCLEEKLSFSSIKQQQSVLDICAAARWMMGGMNRLYSQRNITKQNGLSKSSFKRFLHLIDQNA